MNATVCFNTLFVSPIYNSYILNIILFFYQKYIRITYYVNVTASSFHFGYGIPVNLKGLGFALTGMIIKTKAVIIILPLF